VLDNLSLSMAPVMPSGLQMISAFPSRAGASAGSVRIAAGDLPGQTLRAAAGLDHGVGISTASNSPQRCSRDRAAQAVKVRVGAPTGETAPTDPRTASNTYSKSGIFGSSFCVLERSGVFTGATPPTVSYADRWNNYALRWGQQGLDGS
jgi:hypothetical protein